MGQQAVIFGQVESARSLLVIVGFEDVIPVSAVLTGQVFALARLAAGVVGARGGHCQDVVGLLPDRIVPHPALVHRVDERGVGRTAVDRQTAYGVGSGERGLLRIWLRFRFGIDRLLDRLRRLGNLETGRLLHDLDVIRHRIAGEDPVIVVGVVPVLRAFQVEFEGLGFERQRNRRHIGHLVGALRHERAGGLVPVGIGEGDRPVGIVAQPGAFALGNLTVELRQVHRLSGVGVRRPGKDAVPVFGVLAGPVHAGSGRIAVGEDLSEREHQIVVHLGGGSPAFAVPAPRLVGGFVELRTVVSGARASVDPEVADRIRPGQRLRELGHFERIGARFAVGRGHDDLRIALREVDRPARGDIGRGLIGERQRFDPDLRHVRDHVRRQLQLDDARFGIGLRDGRRSGLTLELDVDDRPLVVPAAVGDIFPRIVLAGCEAQQDESAQQIFQLVHNSAFS